MKVLLVGFETECCALSILAQRLEESGHETLLAEGDLYNVIDSNFVRDFFDRVGFENWVGLDDEYARLYDEDWIVDWDYLQIYESKHCHNKNIEQLMRTGGIIFRDHHFRTPYYRPKNPSSELQYFWLMLQLKWVEQIFNSFDPDLVFTLNRNYLIKNAVAQFALAEGVPIRTLVRSRIADFHHMTRNFGYGTEDEISSYVVSEQSLENLSEARRWVDRIRNAHEHASLYDARSTARVEQTTLYSVGEIVKSYADVILRMAMRILNGSKIKYRGTFRPNYFNSYNPSVLRFHTRLTYNRLKYILSNPFEDSIPRRPFIYVPLHTLPESSTLTLSTEYYEDDLIRYMAKELPVDMKMVIKENPNMIGLRPFGYYEKLNRLPNVFLVDPSLPSKSLIEKSRGVTGISGTALLEAAALGKPTHCFGRPEFEAVIDYSGYGDFRSFVDVASANGGPRDEKRAVRYFQYVLDHGRVLSQEPIHSQSDIRSLGVEAFQEQLSVIEDLLREEIATI